MNKSNKKPIILVCAIVLFIAGGILYSILKNNAQKIPDNVLGNTAGNLNNSGYFCESEGVVYFANPYDHNFLYSMNSNGSDIKKLQEMEVKYLNAGGKYVFFFGKPNTQTTGLGSVVAKPGMYRLDKDGKNLHALTKDVSQNMILFGNTIYYQHYTNSAGVTLAKLDLSKETSTELLPYMVNPSCCYGGRLYYNGMYDNHYLYCYDLSTESESVVWEGNIWNPIYDGNYVYYMDVLNDYRICRYNPSANTIEILVEERVDFFNIFGEYIYYQTNSKDPGLYRVHLDGSLPELLRNGIYSYVNATSNYVYFAEFSSPVPVYRTPSFGAVNVTEFTEAAEAVFSN